MSLAARLFSRKSWGGAAGQLIEAHLRGESESLRVTTDSAMRVAAVATCVRLISQTVASLPLHVYERTDNGKRRVEPAKNALEQVLAKPNAWMTPMEFREVLQACLLLRGDGIAWVNWVKAFARDESGSRVEVDRVSELIPLDPDFVVIERKDWKLAPTYAIKDVHGKNVPIPADEILHIRGLSFDGTRGRGVIQDAREVIGVALGTQQYARKFWANDATPGVILSTDQALTKDQADAIAKDFDERHTKEARRTAVLGRGAKIERLALSSNDSQFLETRQFQRSEIAGLFLVPPHMIGDTEKNTSWGTGIEQQQIGFVSYTIRPWLVRWEQAIKRCLINREDRYYVEHQVEGLLRGDIRSRYSAYATGRQWGWLSVNDIRSLENLNPVDDGDIYLQPMNMVPAGANPAEDSLRASAGAPNA